MPRAGETKYKPAVIERACQTALRERRVSGGGQEVPRLERERRVAIRDDAEHEDLGERSGP